MNNHLRNKHSLPSDDRRAATSLLRSRILTINNAASILPRKDGSEIHPHLRVYNGFVCSYCIFRTISKSIISRYVTDVHRQKIFELRARTDEMYIPMYLQIWTKNPADKQYWVVEKNRSNIRPVKRTNTYNHLKEVFKREELRIKNQKASIEQSLVALVLSFIEIRLWLKRIDWPNIYKEVY